MSIVYLEMSPSFVRFALKYKKSDCRFGDVARDIKEDPDVNRNWGYRRFKTYLEERNASDRCLICVEELKELYDAMQESLYRK
jgi:hypothetical protein